MRLMIILLAAGLMITAQTGAQTDPAAATTVETIVCIRHGEKPSGGLGQLTCKGLNRSLALPRVLLGKYGAPNYIFAPNPAQKVDGGARYYYVRPLATIEPTAISCGLPVNTQFGYKEIAGLEDELDKEQYRRATVFVAWEHGLPDDFVKQMVQKYGADPKQVPDWPGKDYDSIFLLKITRGQEHPSIAFTIDHEGLDNLSPSCPSQ